MNGVIASDVRELKKGQTGIWRRGMSFMTRIRCLCFLSGSSGGAGFVPAFDTDLYTEAIRMFNGKVWRFSVSRFFLSFL